MKHADFKHWKKVRANGKLSYIKKFGLFYWGWPMFLMMTFIVPYNENLWDKPITHFVVQFLIWTCAGIIFGLSMWHFNEKRFVKHLNNH